MTSVTDERVPELLGQLSQRHASEGDLRRAKLAAWAADVHVLEELLWQNGLGDAPDPDAQLAALGEVVAGALDALADRAPNHLTARQLVEAAREAMVTTFDESVHGLLTDRLAALDHLDLCEPVAHDAVREAERRLDGRTAEGLVAELRFAAADCMAVAQLLASEGEEDAARRLAHQADAAAFEAYLVAAASLGGDERLATVDLRWELGRTVLSGRPADGSKGALGDWRPGLLALVGSAESGVLGRTLEALPEP
ncbi:MAG: hypothetical protein JWN22_1226 [Nocardioides sp.]|jgi:hypothetical protein|nr:hypothetical protein [Nocardioides sp.]